MSWIKRIKIKVIASVAILASMGCGIGVCRIEAAIVGEPKFVLVLDPGHGGKDFGATENGQKEKDINLAVGKALSHLVKKKLKDVDVIMTRDDDTYLTLQERATKANRAKGDLFISIHTNSVDKSNKNRSNVSGASVYTLGLHKEGNNMEVARRENSVIELENNFEQKYSGFDPSKDESYIIFEMAQKKNLHNSIRFAKSAQQQLVAHAGRKDRGVHQAGFWVLWATSMPAVLVELDFICNPSQATYLGSDKGVKELSESLFEAVKGYVENHKSSSKTTFEKESSNSKSGRGKDLSSYDTQIEESTEESPMLLASVSGGGSLMAESSSNHRENKETKISAERESHRQEYAQRRRRSSASRQKSESRDLQTSEIPLHTARERLATPIKEEAAESPGPSLSPKELAKKEREARKAAEKARKEEAKARKDAQKKESAKKKNSKAKKGGKFQTIYKIQILASKDQLKANNPRFLGLAPITMIKENNLYKYTYGEFSTKAEAEEALKVVKKKISDAFIIDTMRSTN